MFLNNILEDLYWRSADNATVWDTKGQSYIDFTSGIFAANIGHANPYVTDAIKKNAAFIHSYTYNTEIREQYLAELCEFTGYEAAAMFSSGTEATEAAWKMARQYTGKWGMYGMHHAFHGKTYGALIMASAVPSQYYAQTLDKTSMLIMEPYIAHTAQMRDDNAINRVRGLVNEGKLLLCLDEIQAGFGRTGKLFCYQHYDYLEPDLVCIGKGMGNGFPMSAVLGPKKIISEPVMALSSTHGGNPLACAVGLAVLRYFRDHDVIAEAERKGKILHDRLAELPFPASGVGMVAAVWPGSRDAANKLVKLCHEFGILVVHTDRETVKLGPPLTIPYNQLEVGLDLLHHCCNKVFKEL